MPSMDLNEHDCASKCSCLEHDAIMERWNDACRQDSHRVGAPPSSSASACGKRQVDN